MVERPGEEIHVHQETDSKTGASIKLQATAGPADDRTPLHKGTDSTTVYVRTAGDEVAADVTPVKDTDVTHISETREEAVHKDKRSAELDAVAASIVHENITPEVYPSSPILLTDIPPTQIIELMNLG